MTRPLHTASTATMRTMDSATPPKLAQAPKAQVRRTLHYYFKLMRRYKWIWLLNLIMPMAAIVCGEIGLRYFIGQLFGAQLPHLQTTPLSAIWHTFYIIIALVLGQIVFWRINDYTYIKRQAKTMRDIEQFLFNRLQQHSYRFFSDTFAGSLTTQFNRFLNSYEIIEDIFEFELLQAGVTLTFSVAVLLVVAPILGVILLIWGIVFITLITWLTVKKSPITREASAADSRVTANVADAITNMLNIKVFARKDFESKRFATTSQDRYQKRWRSFRFNAHIRNVRWVLAAGFLFLFIYLSIKLVVDGSVSLAVVLTAQLYVMSIYSQLFNLNQTIQQLELAFSDASEMTEILDRAIEIKDPAQPEVLRINRGLVTCKAVSFRYDHTASEVLSDFSLQIEAGQKVGLVGHSGSGKSTLTRLMLRFADLQSGEILIDGQNIAHITQDDLRSQIAYVPQEPILFHRSLMENIRYGRDDASDEEVYAAAQQAHAADFIEDLPEGYDTMVGERGIKLSGGEKQRIAIARAMLSRAPILILDEATSALDSKSEKLITTALNELMRHRTTIVIAHRLSTIRKMDRILVMKNGVIIEDGTHQTLLAKQGEYAELWTHQSGGFIEE